MSEYGISKKLLTMLKNKSAFSDIQNVNEVKFNKSETLKDIERIAITAAKVSEDIKRTYTERLLVEANNLSLDELATQIKVLNDITRSTNVDIKAQINKQNDISTSSTLDFGNVKLVFNDTAFSDAAIEGDDNE